MSETTPTDREGDPFLRPLAEGRYRLLEPLGVGGMAVVYKAWDERLQCHRAVKLLSKELARSPSVRKRFESEARTMARLHHPNIVAVQDVGADGERLYIVMEFVPAGSLMDFIQAHGPMPPRMAVEAMLPVLAALEEAHDHGIIHRDIKPHNVLVTMGGRPKVTDFGIAHVSSEDMSMTKTGSVMGTWGFMAPEQRISARKVDARADVYAAASTLYCLITNETPVDLFAGEIDGEMLKPLSEVLRPIVSQATRYKPEERYRSAAELGHVLQQVIPRLPAIPEDFPRLGFTSEQRQVEIEGGTIIPARDMDTDGPQSMPTFSTAYLDMDPGTQVPQSTTFPGEETESKGRSPWGLAIVGGLVLLVGAGLWIQQKGAGPVEPLAVVEPVAEEENPEEMGDHVGEVDEYLEAKGEQDAETIRSVVQANVPRLKICYESELLNTPNLEGRVVIGLSIRDGDVNRAEIEENTSGSNELAGCIQQMVRGIPFPLGLSGDIVYPFVYALPRKAAPAASVKPVVDEASAPVEKEEAQAEDVAEEAPLAEPTFTAIPMVKGQSEGLRFVSVSNPADVRMPGVPLLEGEWQVQYRFEADGNWLTADANLRIGEGLKDSVTCDAVSFKKCVVRR